MRARDREILLLLGFLIGFFALFSISFFDWKMRLKILSIGLPYSIIDPLFMVLSVLSMLKAFYHLLHFPDRAGQSF